MKLLFLQKRSVLLIFTLISCLAVSLTGDLQKAEMQAEPLSITDIGRALTSNLGSREVKNELLIDGVKKEVWILF